jgi:hypothetical protein
MEKRGGFCLIFEKRLFAEFAEQNLGDRFDVAKRDYLRV